MTTEIEPRSSAASGETPVPGDVVTVLTGQHERARALLAELRESVAVVAELTHDMAGPFRELVELLATHEAAEEIVVYPRLKTELQEGRLAEECLAEEHKVKQLLAKLEKMAPAFFGFPDALAGFEDKLVAHAEHENGPSSPSLRPASRPPNARSWRATSSTPPLERRRTLTPTAPRARSATPSSAQSWPPSTESATPRTTSLRAATGVGKGCPTRHRQGLRRAEKTSHQGQRLLSRYPREESGQGALHGRGGPDG